MEVRELTIGNKKVYLYECGSSAPLLIQPADDHDLEVLDSEVTYIKELSESGFTLAAFKIDDWNNDLSPWEAPPVFGNESFGSGAGETLRYIIEELVPALTNDAENEFQIILGGYSLAGLFSLWAGYQTDRFAGIAAASPSVWFPGWMDLAENNHIRAGKVYLSLGDKEERTRNPVMRTVGDNIRRQIEILRTETASDTCAAEECILEMNQGNHFRDPDLRTAKAFAWILRSL